MEADNEREGAAQWDTDKQKETTTTTKRYENPKTEEERWEAGLGVWRVERDNRKQRVSGWNMDSIVWLLLTGGTEYWQGRTVSSVPPGSRNKSGWRSIIVFFPNIWCSPLWVEGWAQNSWRAKVKGQRDQPVNKQRSKTLPPSTVHNHYMTENSLKLTSLANLANSWSFVVIYLQ